MYNNDYIESRFYIYAIFGLFNSIYLKKKLIVNIYSFILKINVYIIIHKDSLMFIDYVGQYS